MKRRLGLSQLTVVAVLASLVGAGTASAAPVTIPLSSFVIFSGGGLTFNAWDTWEVNIGGHDTVTGNIGSNQDLLMQGNPLPGYPAQLNGSVYVGGYFKGGQDLTIGSAALIREIVVNGTNPTASAGQYESDFSGTFYGNMYVTGTGATVHLSDAASVVGNIEFSGTTCFNCDAAHVSGTVTSPSTKTFTPIVMPAATVFVGGGTNQTCTGGGCTSLALAPNTHYGTLTLGQNKTLNLSSGNYYFDAIDATGGLTIQIDLTSGQPINIYIVGNAAFGSTNIMVKGSGTGGAYMLVNDPAAQSLAGLIRWETYAKFTTQGGTDGSHTIWGGTVYASVFEQANGGAQGIDFGQYMDWYGAIYAYDSIDLADHGLYVLVPPPGTNVPEPASLLLLGTGLVGLRRFCRHNKR